MNDKLCFNTTFTLQEGSAITIALLDYGSRKLGIEFPPEMRNDEIFKDFNKLSKFKRIQIYMDCMQEMIHGARKAMLDARLKEMGNEEDKE